LIGSGECVAIRLSHYLQIRQSDVAAAAKTDQKPSEIARFNVASKMQ
jgi:hypothetical protein